MKTVNKWLIVLAVLGICFFVASILLVINSGVYNFNSGKVNCIGINEIKNFFVKNGMSDESDFRMFKDFFINAERNFDNIGENVESNIEIKTNEWELKVEKFGERIEESVENITE